MNARRTLRSGFTTVRNLGLFIQTGGLLLDVALMKAIDLGWIDGPRIVPAGHALIAREATPTWEQWQTYVGDTWATMHTRAPRWVDHHSAGIDLGDAA